MNEIFKEIINILNSLLLEKKNKVKNASKAEEILKKLNENIINIKDTENITNDEKINDIKIILKGIYDNGLDMKLTEEQKNYLNNYRDKIFIINKEYKRESLFEIELLEKLINNFKAINLNNLNQNNYDTIYMIVNSKYIAYELKEKVLLELLKREEI